MDDVLADKLAIREVVDNWVLWSDSGDWQRFATVWHADAWMTATWFQGPATAFAAARRAGFERGVSIIHFLGGTTCEVAENRAIAQTKMTIDQRATVDGVVVDAVCTGRFYDFFEKRGAGGASCDASRSTRRTGSIRSIRPPSCVSTQRCSRAFPKATGTSPTCRPRPAST
jgi:hypothetical protein